MKSEDTVRKAGTDVVSPWHCGERLLQASVGLSAQMESIGPKVIRGFMPSQHREFYRQLPYVLVGTVDSDGWPWASYLIAEPGFIDSPNERELRVNTLLLPQDPGYKALDTNMAIGMLGIEPLSRRRNRVNGRVSEITAGGFVFAIEQTMGNCPKYIQAKEFSALDFDDRGEQRTSIGTVLTEPDIRLINQADTFYVASYFGDADKRQVDVSHRGGEVGFVTVNAKGHIAIPDYSGNNFFCTLGNIEVTAKAGLTFADDSTGDLLQISGHAVVERMTKQSINAGGPQRMWHVEPQVVVHRTAVLPFQRQ